MTDGVHEFEMRQKQPGGALLSTKSQWLKLPVNGLFLVAFRIYL
jgi:hypothetical protein